MLLHKLTDDPDLLEVEAAITRARQAVAMYRHLGDEVLSVLSERAMNAALEVRTELLKQQGVSYLKRGVHGVCKADHRCAYVPVAIYYHYGDSTGDRVCQDHLNLWLDLADDGEIDEPAGLMWLAPTGGGACVR